ncbi:hypothetical protein AB1207_15000 [Kineococcus endophyticus]|uniref:Uncharacterized protein n=1 Tax=Kineococcus endophyticus TaxID=1181883 RepID=A0ABV3P8V2_9ACTN
MSPAPTDPTLLTRHVTRAVEAAHRGDAADFTAATTDLAAFDAEQARVVLGWVLRQALEEQHPDGLDADDVRAAMAATARGAAWFGGLDPRILVVVLVAALGEHPDPEEVPRLGHALVLQHSVLLVHDLATGPGRPLRRALDAALAEVRRAETMEMP